MIRLGDVVRAEKAIGPLDVMRPWRKRVKDSIRKQLAETLAQAGFIRGPVRFRYSGSWGIAWVEGTAVAVRRTK